MENIGLPSFKELGTDGKRNAYQAIVDIAREEANNIHRSFCVFHDTRGFKKNIGEIVKHQSTRLPQVVRFPQAVRIIKKLAPEIRDASYDCIEDGKSMGECKYCAIKYWLIENGYDGNEVCPYTDNGRANLREILYE